MTLEVAYTTQLLACSEEGGRGEEEEGGGRGREGRREEGGREKGWEREHSGMCANICWLNFLQNYRVNAYT